MSKMLSDANLLISFFASDSNAEHAERVIEQVTDGKLVLVVPVVVVQELCYVFESPRFSLQKQQIAETLIPFLLTVGIEAEERDVVVSALRKYYENNVDFTDAYLAARSIGTAVPVVSFAKDFKKLDCEVYNPKQM